VTTVKLKISMLSRWAAAILFERVPADYSDLKAQAKCRALGEAFAKTPWAEAQGKEFEVDEMTSEALKFARALGYELLEKPPGCYPPAPETYIECWGPSEGG